MSEYLHPAGMEQAFTEQSVQEMFWLGDQIPGGFFIYRADESQEVLFVNRAILRIYGCENEAQFRELTGGTFRGMVHGEDFDEIQASIDQQIADDNNHNLDYVEYRIIRRDGAVRWVDDYGHFAHFPGYGDVYYVFISDVTDKRLAQEEKRRVEMELARQKQIDEMRADFLFNMSHDIRTPMNAVVGFSTLAKRHIGEPERLNEYLDKAIASGKQMLTLIEDMLEMNRLGTGRYALHEEACSLRGQIEMVMDMHRPDADAKGVALTENLDLPRDTVVMDQSTFRRVLSNLLSNAVKFTPPGGSVTVAARQTRAGETGFARFAFRVIDTGIGISKDFLGRMYDPFEREATSTKTRVAGTGLGLSIVRSLLDMMGGSIACESEKGKGTAFTVELPLRLAGDCPPPADVPEAEEARAAGEYRVLVVEDIELNRELAVTLLQESGFLVESVPDGCDAVEAVKRRPAGYYDLILMDIQMPVMNGYEATRAIRALPRADAALLPIIALSANAREEDKRMSLQSGMNAHEAKPFDIDHLVQTINSYIERKCDR